MSLKRLIRQKGLCNIENLNFFFNVSVQQHVSSYVCKIPFLPYGLSKLLPLKNYIEALGMRVRQGRPSKGTEISLTLYDRRHSDRVRAINLPSKFLHYKHLNITFYHGFQMALVFLFVETFDSVLNLLTLLNCYVLYYNSI